MRKENARPSSVPRAFPAGSLAVQRRVLAPAKPRRAVRRPRASRGPAGPLQKLRPQCATLAAAITPREVPVVCPGRVQDKARGPPTWALALDTLLSPPQTQSITIWETDGRE